MCDPFLAVYGFSKGSPYVSLKESGYANQCTLRAP